MAWRYSKRRTRRPPVHNAINATSGSARRDRDRVPRDRRSRERTRARSATAAHRGLAMGTVWTYPTAANTAIRQPPDLSPRTSRCRRLKSSADQRGAPHLTAGLASCSRRLSALSISAPNCLSRPPKPQHPAPAAKSYRHITTEPAGATPCQYPPPPHPHPSYYEDGHSHSPSRSFEQRDGVATSSHRMHKKTQEKRPVRRWADHVALSRATSRHRGQT